MADNQVVPVPSGQSFTAAMDDVAGVKYQKIKITDGRDGGTDDIPGDSTHGLWVNIKAIDGALSIIIGGNVASGAADSGNPVKMGGKYNLTPITLADAQRGDLQLDPHGYLKAVIADLVASGAVDSGSSIKVGTKYNSTPPTFADGQRGEFQIDSHGKLLISINSTADKSDFVVGVDGASPLAGLYQAVIDTIASGKTAALAIDQNRNLKVTLATKISGEDQTNDLIGVLSKPIVGSTYALTPYTNLTSLQTKGVAKAFPGNVMSLDITNDNAAVRYFQLHNKATNPAATNVPVRSWKIPAGTANNPGRLTLTTTYFSEGGYYLSTGIGWAISTTLATFTDSATASEHNVDINFV